MTHTASAGHHTKRVAQKRLRPDVLHIPTTLKLGNAFIRYVADHDVRAMLSLDKRTWFTSRGTILEPREGYFDSGPLSIAGYFIVKKLVLMVYYVKEPFALGVAFFSGKDPSHILWRSALPIWTSSENLSFKDISKRGDQVIIRLITQDGAEVRVVLHLKHLLSKTAMPAILRTEKRGRPYLNRAHNNPILTPHPANEWESVAAFNPAALYDDGKIHLLYRAIGNTNVSTIGYAVTRDGTSIAERSAKPVYVPRESFEGTQGPKSGPPVSSYVSGGGGYGGCEDPRLIKIEDRIYLMYTAFDGWGSIRMAMTSIGEEDFRKQKWSWKKSVLISPPGEIHKNWVLFPEKIGGKFAILHSVSPEILIDYFDTLDVFEQGHAIKSCFDRSPRKNVWDNKMRGVGPPPIKTKDGWLVLYHAMDARDPNRYKLGAMLLDLKNPAKILYRSKAPILEPDEHYENHGYKAGVVYSCGAVVKDDHLYVYYGGADMVSCVASYSLNMFLRELKHSPA